MDTIHTRAAEIGHALHGNHLPADTLLDKSWWERHALAWLTADPAVKTRILRFIDLYPTLSSPATLLRHLREYLPDDTSRLPAPLVAAIRLVDTPLATPRAVAAVTDAAIRRIARTFIAGATPAEAGGAIDRLLREECACTVDLLGEATLTDAEGEAALARYRELLGYLVATRATGDPTPEISVKPTSLLATFDPAAPVRSSADARVRLRPLFRQAMESGARINVDMESFVYRDLTLATFTDLLEEDEFARFDSGGIAFQAYLEDAEEKLEELIGWIARRDVPVRIRLVKGAYWDQELAVADSHGWPLPVRIDKEATDAAFERMTHRLMTCDAPVNIAVATHNVRSAAWALAVAESARLPRERYEFQTLYGMGDDLRRRLVAYGAPVRVYAPVGELTCGIAYLVRRLLENSANESFLRHAAEGMTAEEATRPPSPVASPPRPRPLAEVERRRTFRNEPTAPLHRPDEREAMEKAIARVENLLGRAVDPVIGGA
ncbi:MAG: proline dehydrogenase family protein, partial [Nitrospinae bacterium]|nr:proline dehydrogenase family protein [Nitrospinota bacterium]